MVGAPVDLDVMSCFPHFPGSVLVGGTSVGLGVVPADESHCLIDFALFPLAEWLCFLLLHKLFKFFVIMVGISRQINFMRRLYF